MTTADNAVISSANTRLIFCFDYYRIILYDTVKNMVVLTCYWDEKSLVSVIEFVEKQKSFPTHNWLIDVMNFKPSNNLTEY